MDGEENALAGVFRVEHFDPAGVPLWSVEFPNGVTTQGLDYLQGAVFLGGPQLAAWRLGVIDASGYATVAQADTNAGHPGWGEFTNVGATRPPWVPGSPLGGQLASTVPATLTVTADGSVRGVFLSDRSAVGDLASVGTLYSTGVAGSSFAVVNGGTLSITYLIRGIPGG